MKPKSSTVAQEVKTVSNVYIHSVACGYGHTLMIAKNDTEDEKDAVNKIDVFTPWKYTCISNSFIIQEIWISFIKILLWRFLTKCTE